MRISIKNQTRWSTADLRALYKAALKAAGASAGGALVVKNRRGAGVGGNCWLGRHGRPGLCTLRLPTPETEARGVALSSALAAEAQKEGAPWAPYAPASFRDQVARTMHHEALHAIGARHKDMTEPQMYCTQSVEWARGLALNVEPAAPVQKAAFSDKLAHARSMLARAVTRAKRAGTIEKKWARRVKMLERRKA